MRKILTVFLIYINLYTVRGLQCYSCDENEGVMCHVDLKKITRVRCGGSDPYCFEGYTEADGKYRLEKRCYHDKEAVLARCRALQEIEHPRDFNAAGDCKYCNSDLCNSSIKFDPLNLILIFALSFVIL